MSKRVVVGQSEWGLADDKAADVTAAIKAAMENKTVAVLPLLSSAGKEVTVYLNGSIVPTVAIDLDSDPKPSEIFG